MGSPDDFRDDDVTAFLRIAIRRNGAMSVEGCITDEPLAKAMLDAARESITKHNARKINDTGLILPPTKELKL
jgi:hypothetical protein